ncbi:MAG: bifunctional phosphoserine phosphatase/homoserine phosphotransferase ThrH [Candidatus Paceibacterota bacterium]
MYILCSDLESVFIPELWIEIAEETGIDELKLTTRDVADLDLLMQKRLTALKENKIGIERINDILEKSEPFEGAREVLNEIRENIPVVILSDTFWGFASLIIKKLNYPTVICNSLEIDNDGYIANYKIRKNGKKRAVRAFKELGYQTVAMGDSFNDTEMLKEADKGVFFNASEKTRADFPEFPAIKNYKELKKYLKNYKNGK